MAGFVRLVAALLAACCALSWALAAGVQDTSPRLPVRNAAELLEALGAAAETSAPSNTVIELEQDVALSQSAVQGLALPFNLSTGKTLTIKGGGRPLGRACTCPGAGGSSPRAAARCSRLSRPFCSIRCCCAHPLRFCSRLVACHAALQVEAAHIR